MPSLSSHSLPN